MAEIPDQARVDAERALYRLAQDVNALLYRVREELDWRSHFRRHPWRFLGLGFGVSLLAGMLSRPARVCR